MGRTYSFECPRCGYRARVAGGTAEGSDFAVQTIACTDCMALYDAVIQFKATPRQKENPPRTGPKFSTVLNRLPVRGARHWLKFKPTCPVSPLHRIRLWKRPDKCPKCATYLEAGALPYRLWD